MRMLSRLTHSALLALALIFGVASVAAQSSSDSSMSAKASKAAAAMTEKLDINSATKDQLDALPGIGSTYADKIIGGRPHRTKSELVTKKKISQSLFQKKKKQKIAFPNTSPTRKAKEKFWDF